MFEELLFVQNLPLVKGTIIKKNMFKGLFQMFFYVFI